VLIGYPARFFSNLVGMNFNNKIPTRFKKVLAGILNNTI